MSRPTRVMPSTVLERLSARLGSVRPSTTIQSLQPKCSPRTNDLVAERSAARRERILEATLKIKSRLAYQEALQGSSPSVVKRQDGVNARRINARQQSK